MTVWIVLMFVSLMLMLMLGYPVAFTLGAVALLFGGVFLGLDFFHLLPLRIWGVMTNFTLLAVPLFIFMGIVLDKSGLAEDLLETMGLLFGRRRGGLAVSVVIVGALLAATTGVVGATVVTMGIIALPTMLRRQYSSQEDITVDIPCGLFTCITGVSGSGKSTLINQTLYPVTARELNGATTLTASPHRGVEGLEHLEKVVDIDQSPIGRTPRSNPATYTGLFTPIRELFAQTRESRARGYKPGRFSFNVKGGRCEACQGDGMLKVEMHFLPDIYVPCDVCKGKRYNRETLEVRYKHKNIHQVLDMTVEEARGFFDAVPVLSRKLQTLVDVGLSYIKLGQSATTLSGGEAQRVKLSRELSKRDTGKTLYILDEPTTGLHFQDIAQLLEVLHRLRDHGNTVVVIEHNLDVVKTADWIVDLGPEGGSGGGQIVAVGTPEAIAEQKDSHTGQYLKRVLGAAHRRVA